MVSPAYSQPQFQAEGHFAIEGPGSPIYNGATVELTVSGTNSLIIAAWHSEYDGGFPNSWRVECNGVPGTLITDTNGYKGVRRFRSYYWLNPTLGANTILVTNDVYASDNELAVSAILLTNVPTVGSLGSHVLDVSTSNRTSESETITTTPNDLVVHIIAYALVTQGTLGGGETSRSVANDGKHAPAGDASLWVSTKLGGASSATVSSTNWISSVVNGVAIVVHGYELGIPTAPDNLMATAVSGNQIDLSWTASTDNGGVTGYLVERQDSGNPAFVQVGTSTNTAFEDLGLTPNTNYSYRVRATDAVGNLSAYSTVASAVTLNTNGILVAAYGFNEGRGTTAMDVSGYDNFGTLSGADWTAQGKYGQGLSFTSSGFVTIQDSASLNLINGMTLEAWVYPTTAPGNWTTVLMKETTNSLDYMLQLNPDGYPATYITTTLSGGPVGIVGTSVIPLNAWSHLAGTYDGVNLKLYLNGDLVASNAVSGEILTSPQPLRIGGNTVLGEYYQGSIDEVRIYNQALVLEDIQADMASATLEPQFTLTSVPGQAADQIAQGGFHLHVTANLPAVLALEVSTNLVSWQEFGTLQYTNGQVEVIDLGATSSVTRYYRTRWP